MINSDTQVTKEMIKAGEDIETEMGRARIRKWNNKWDEYKKGNRPNQDIVIEHIENNMTNVEAIYRAMERARKIGYPQPTTCMHHPV